MNRPASGWLMLAAVSLVFVGLDQINSVASLFNTQTAGFRRAEYALFLGSTLIAVVFFTRRRWNQRAARGLSPRPRLPSRLPLWLFGPACA